MQSFLFFCCYYFPPCNLSLRHLYVFHSACLFFLARPVKKKESSSLESILYTLFLKVSRNSRNSSSRSTRSSSSSRVGDGRKNLYRGFLKLNEHFDSVCRCPTWNRWARGLCERHCTAATSCQVFFGWFDRLRQEFKHSVQPSRQPGASSCRSLLQLPVTKFNWAAFHLTDMSFVQSHSKFLFCFFGFVFVPPHSFRHTFISPLSQMDARDRHTRPMCHQTEKKKNIF